MAYGANNRFFWGHQAANRNDALVWTKLLIDGSPAVDIQGSNLEGIVTGRTDLPGGRPVATFIGDFLGALRMRILETLQTRAVDPQVTWCLAMPGCWSTVGAQVFRDAVTHFHAPGHQVHFTSESWAAARWVEYSLRANEGIRTGEVLLVCDCGGATTDLDLIGVDGIQPYRFRSPEKATSRRCGGVDVESGLLQQLRVRFHSPRGFVRGETGATARRAVSEAKQQFTGEHGNYVDSQILRGGTLRRHRFEFGDFVAAFDPLVTTAYDSISRMIGLHRGKVTKVVLVGGMSNSSYFRKYIQNALNDLPADSRPRLLDPIPDAISAVARGAVLQAMGQPRRIESLKGYQVSFPFIEPGPNGFENCSQSFVAIRQVSHLGHLRRRDSVCVGDGLADTVDRQRESGMFHGKASCKRWYAYDPMRAAVTSTCPAWNRQV
ncbi:hypothetical protein AbraIFM66951_007953 [Aspergillus brasiliensis]|uniref:Uncharacterized protein n=1 Tax=Aspergillus brasiliensis TaxID=319629 RepID=A0A9W5YRM1_9EURO|nr:hypothetical protein AbraCBS73388_008459 [Aspergillus brasiliensis]GKZ45336.1 hypothetical protein AbraIFM66951_007953 [Aspergillus brasiliensis]